MIILRKFFFRDKDEEEASARRELFWQTS